MATVEEGLRSQIRNIEATYGRSIDDWIALIRSSGLARHGQIVAMLKAEHGLTHGAANRVALVSLAALAPATPDLDPVDALYAGRPPAVRAIHDRIWSAITALGDDIEVAPKKGYLGLRRRIQFGMIQPAASLRERPELVPFTFPMKTRFPMGIAVSAAGNNPSAEPRGRATSATIWAGVTSTLIF